MPLSAGTRLGVYQVISPLGAGGMGEVYRARDTRLEREVALKILPQDVASSPDRLARFEREARTVAGLNHPNIVVLYAIEEHDATRYLAMELVEGENLTSVITQGGLPLRRLLDLAIPMIDALVAAHEKGIVHRDLKPANVMVTREGRVKVLDFGLAKEARAESRIGDTQGPTIASPISDVGLVVGTVPYMAPEQLRGEEADARSDVFAFGIILYELAAGRRPFVGETSVDVSHAILREEPAPLADLRADLPGDLGRIVNRCLAKSPRGRFQTALDVANELRDLRRTLERGGTRDEAPQTKSKVASIAVLPFANRSASTEDEYFSDGLADELLNLLAKIKGLHVSARTSSFWFRGKGASLQEVGRALKVATVLDGSVRKAGNRVRISVQLVKVEDGYHLWSETYDRTLDDIFAVQDDIARSVVKELRAALLGEESGSSASGRTRAEVAQAAKGRGTDPEAHRLYLQACYLVDRAAREEMEQGVALLERALTIDPRNARAWAKLGKALNNLEVEGALSPEEIISRSRAAAERAIELEPEAPEGHSLLGWHRAFHDWDWRGARESFARALELAPSDSGSLNGLATLVSCLGPIEEAVELYQRAVEQNPLTSVAYGNLGRTFHRCGRLDEAEAAIRKALELSPRRATLHTTLALILLDAGRVPEALAEAKKEHHGVFRLYVLAIVNHVLGDLATSNAALAELIEARDSAFQVAEIHGFRQEIDDAYGWLEQAYKQRDTGLAEMKFSPYLRSLHADSRWPVFLRKMGLD